MLLTIYHKDKTIEGVAFEIDGIRHCTHDITKEKFGSPIGYCFVTSVGTLCNGTHNDWEVLCKEWKMNVTELDLVVDKGTGDVKTYGYYFADIDVNKL